MGLTPLSAAKGLTAQAFRIVPDRDQQSDSCVWSTTTRHREDLATAVEEGGGDARQLKQLLARAVANWAFRVHRRKPLIIPVIIDA
ncbi:hypothetical protein [Streptomyces sp. NPDC020742]|uniref:hypothetical protein n=1 Tax=Streptomyces sp. NPDC020742 TaxID=3154897 RepID=UPI0033D433D1